MRRSILSAALLLLVLTACGDDDSGDDAGQLDVVAAFLPLEEAAVRVGGEAVTVRNLTPPGAEPHDIELSPRDVDQIIDADVVLHLGASFQPAIADAAENAEGRAVDVLLAVEQDESADPHIWLDPARMIAIVEEVRDALSQADPDREAEFQRNADAYTAELRQLDEDMRAGLQTCERRVIVTAHDAFGYLAERYGLVEKPIAGLSPEEEPDPARLASLADDVRADGTTTIFYETLVSPEIAETLAREAGVDAAVLNPIEGLTDEQKDAGATYETLMRENLAALQAALGCT
jgi:zinc transport system substrate-binding protein